jgi:hypothetical protein
MIGGGMSHLAELFSRGRTEEVWQQCCGFIDLSLEDAMRVQRQLLLEQIDLLKGCELGRFILNGGNPYTVEEFRERVPLTTYEDYAPYLLAHREDALPMKPALWQYTSGKWGEYSYRWAPLTARQLEEIESIIFAILSFSSCNKRGQMSLKKHDKVLYGMAPPPYATGTMTHVFPHELFQYLPSVDESEKMSFEERTHRGFELALSEGLDICIAMSSVAVGIGERFQQKSSGTDVRALLKKPKAAVRLARAFIKSKLAGRPMLPKDLWPLKSLVTYGIDSSVFKDKIKEMWGREPLEFHGCTEAVFVALQTWDRQSMTLIPHLNFLEFIPEEESLRSREDPAYQPRTLLLDEVKPGNYELVITSLHGGPFVRYRLGHMVKITSLRNENLNIDIPQMEFLARVDNQIDIAGFTRLSEKVIWQAIEDTGIEYEDWVARKEVEDEPTLHLYIEPRNGKVSPEAVANAIHEKLKTLDTPYSELESFTGMRPLKVTLLPRTAFKIYKRKQQAAGADLTQLKPPHINPSDETVEFLLNETSRVAATAREVAV